MNKLNKLGYTKIEILVIVVLLGLVAFITINKTSYAFAIDNGSAVEQVKNLIELQAEDFGLDNLNLFNETDTTFINVSDLINSGYLIANSNGLITNPADVNKSYNNNKIKLEYDRLKNEVKATLID